MGDNKRYYWIKLKTDFFNQETIDFLLSQKNGCEYIVLYQMLCLNTANNNGEMCSKIGEMIVPYNVDKIVRDTKYFDFDTVTIALGLFKQLGISMTDANGKMRTTTELLPDIANAMRSQATESQKAYIATQLFGRGGQSLIQMLEGGAEGLNALTAEAERMGIVVDQDGVDSAKAFGDNLDRLKFSLLGVSLSIGQHIIPIIEPMINAFREWIITNREMIATAIVDYCREFAETLKQIDFKALVTTMIDFVKQCNSIFKALGGLKTVAIVVSAIFASKLLTSIFGIVSAVGTLTKAVWSLGVALLSTPVGWIIAVIAVIIGALVALWYYWDDVVAFFKAGWDLLIQVFQKAVDWLKSNFTDEWNACAKAITWYWELVKSFYGTLWDGICGYFKWAWGVIKEIANFICGIPQAISSAFDGLVSFFKDVWDGIYNTFFKPFADMYDNIAGKIDTVKGWGSKVGDTVSSAWDSAKNVIGLGSDEKLTTAQAVQGNSKMEGTLDIKVHTDEGVKADVEPKKDSENLNMNVQNRGALRT